MYESKTYKVAYKSWAGKKNRLLLIYMILFLDHVFNAIPTHKKFVPIQGSFRENIEFMEQVRQGIVVLGEGSKKTTDGHGRLRPHTDI